MRRALLASPLCAAIAILPGPCTTFDNVTEPAQDAGLDAPPDDHAAPPDSEPAASCEGGVRFALGDASACQDLLDRGCCIPEQECAARTACRTWVACVNQCPVPREAGCINACGSTSSFADVLKSLSECRTFADAGALCPWP